MAADDRRNDEPARIADELARAHAGDPWHGPSLAGNLAGVTAVDARTRPIGGAHSIWELVLHVTAWTDEVARRLRTGRIDVPEAGDWPAVPEAAGAGDDDAAAWTATLAALDDAHVRLREAVAGLAPARLDAPAGESREPALGSGVSTWVMLHGVAQHDAYHSGQIALLRRAIGR